MTLRKKPGTVRDSTEALVPEGNFWDIGNYKPVLKRISHGPKLCDELTRMMQERASLDKHFSKELSSFAEKWEDRLQSRLPEYGTLLDGWLAVTAEARQLADIHMTCKTRVEDVLKSRVETWKKEHYKKSILHLKSYKRASAAFDKAQAPWAKRKEKIDKHRNNALKYAQQAEQLRAHPDAGESSKIQDNIKKAISNEKQSREKLRLRVEELMSYKDIYRREMALEFERCQIEEKERINFFKETLIELHKLMDNSKAIYDAHAVCLSRVQQVDSEKDLAQFSREFGIDMPMIIADKDGTWYLEGSTPPSQGGQPYAPKTPSHATSNAASNATLSAEENTTQNGNSVSSQDAQAISGMPTGTKLVALYDYEGNHSDELSFAAQDIILLEANPQVEVGWLCGTHTGSGKMGIFPGNYVSIG